MLVWTKMKFSLVEGKSLSICHEKRQVIVRIFQVSHTYIPDLIWWIHEWRTLFIRTNILLVFLTKTISWDNLIQDSSPCAISHFQFLSWTYTGPFLVLFMLMQMGIKLWHKAAEQSVNNCPRNPGVCSQVCLSWKSSTFISFKWLITGKLIGKNCFFQNYR